MGASELVNSPTPSIVGVYLGEAGFDKRFRLKLAIRAMEYLVENGLKILEFLRS